MKTKYADVHESEWNWAGHPVDYIITNNGTIEDLTKQVEDIRDWNTGEFKSTLKLV
jgi:dephospho-CoA kinase